MKSEIDRMTEQERYTYKKWYGEFQILDYNRGFAVIDTDTQAKIICKELNKLHEENIKLKNYLKEIGYEFKKYSYEETGKKIEDYNTEKLLISLLQNIINDLQNDWRVVDYTSDFTNDLDLRTNQVVEKNISMDIKLKMDGIKWLMIG